MAVVGASGWTSMAAGGAAGALGRGGSEQAKAMRIAATQHDGTTIVWRIPPNESRLSCGAKLTCSQTECYYTVLQDVHRICCG